MKFITLRSILLCLISFGMMSVATAEPPAPLKVSLPQIADQAVMPEKFAFCTLKTDKDGKHGHNLGKNLSPEISWAGAPKGTKSFAVIMHDDVVPTKLDDVNKHDRMVPADLPRTDFYHWILVDIPAKTTKLAEGAESKAVVPKGKKPGKAEQGVRGVNNYTQWFEMNKVEAMMGAYGGYDGPCPPFNDSLVHKYHFTVYALDVESLSLKEGFNGPDALKAMEGHVLAKGKSTGLYRVNPKVAYPKK